MLSQVDLFASTVSELAADLTSDPVAKDVCAAALRDSPRMKCSGPPQSELEQTEKHRASQNKSQCKIEDWDNSEQKSVEINGITNRKPLATSGEVGVALAKDRCFHQESSELLKSDADSTCSMKKPSGSAERNHSALRSLTFSKISTLDRLMASELSSQYFRKHPSSFVSATAAPTLPSHTSPSPSDINWFSSASKSLSVMSRPTFSVADITVIVPSNMSMNNDNAYETPTEAELLFETSSQEEHRKSIRVIPGENRKNSSESLTKIKRDKRNKPACASASMLAKDETKEDCETVSTTKNGSGKLSDCKEHKATEKAEENIATCLLKPRQSLVPSNSPENDCTNHRRDQGFVHGSKNADDDVHNDWSVNSSLSIVTENTMVNTEWRYVESSRNKQKRKQSHILKSIASQPAVLSERRKSSVANGELKKIQIQGSEKSATSSVTTPSINHSKVTSYRHIESRSQANRPVTSEKVTLVVVECEDELHIAADVMQVPVLHKSQLSSKANARESPKNDETSNDLKSSKPKRNSTVVNSQSASSSTVSVSNGKNMSVGASNSNVLTDNAQATEEAAIPAMTSEITNVETSSKKDDMVDMKEGSTAESSSQENSTPQPTGEELTRQLKNQLEYYFSRENLAQDPYLVSQMNSEQYVSIYTIANFNAIKKLTSDLNCVKEALKASRLVELDETNELVRPNQSRRALMLREIAEGVKEEEVAALFDKCPVQFFSCEHAGGTNWYITFDTENDAQTAYSYLRETVRTFKGKPILARMKAKSHHLNTYSYQSLSLNAHESKEQQPPPTSAHEAQQVPPPPVEFIHPHSLLVCPPQYPSAHPTQVAAIPTSLFPRVATQSPAVPVPSSGQGPAAAMPVNPPFNGIVVSPWHSGFFDPSVMAPPIAGHQFVQAFKPPQVAHYQPPSGNSNKPPSNSSGHRFTDFHKEVNQRNSYGHRKSSNSSYSQQQQLNNSSVKNRFVLSNDPNPPNMVQDVVGTYVQSEQASTNVTHSIATHHPGHYIPAVSASLGARAPFVAPSANDPNNFILFSQQHIPVFPPNVHHRPGPRRGPGQSFYSNHHRSHNHHMHNDQSPGGGSSNNQRNRYNNSRPNNYHSEISPRFLAKGTSAHTYSLPAFGYSGPLLPIHPVNNESTNFEAKSSYSNKSHNDNVTANSQRNRSSPNPDGHVTESNKAIDLKDKDNLTEASNNDSNRRSSLATSNPANDQKSSHQGGLEQRRNSRPRRRRNEDEKNALTPTPVPVPKPTFNFESNLFPPLPGAPESDVSVATSQNSESRPTASDSVKIDPAKASSHADPVQGSNPPPKKYSEVSSASHVNRSSQIGHSKAPPLASEAAKPIKKADVKTTSAVNAQPVPVKHSPAVNKRPASSKPSSSEKKTSNDLNKPAAQPRSNSATTVQNVTVSARKPWHSAPAQREMKKSGPVAKSENSTKSDQPSRNEGSVRQRSDSAEPKTKSVVKEEKINDDKDTASTDSNDRKPTYAEVMKTTGLSQMNGKAMSDSSKSDSGDDNPPAEEPKDPEPKAAEPEKPVSKPSSGKSEKDAEPAKPERKAGPGSNSSRRSDFETHRGSWHGRNHRDRNADYRTNRPPRDRPYNSDRSNWDYRGRGGGFRGRRGYYRNYYNNGASRTASGNQPPSDR